MIEKLLPLSWNPTYHKLRDLLALKKGKGERLPDLQDPEFQSTVRLVEKPNPQTKPKEVK